MANLKEYSISMEEIHHTKKIRCSKWNRNYIGRRRYKKIPKKINWALDVTNNPNEIPIVAKRIPDVPGTHSVTYSSTIDDIEIKHTAHNRQGFALGAVVAAEWLVDKTGVFSMKDVLGL